MKVAYLFSRYPVPSQTFCDTEMRALEETGVEVAIFSISPPPTSFRHGAAGRPRRTPVHYLPPAPVLEVWGSAARRLGQWPTGLIAEHTRRHGAGRRPERHALHAVYLVEALRRWGIEHLHVHFTNHATQVAAFVRALGGVPFSFTAHAQDFMVDLGSDDLLREWCREASFVVAVSDFSRRLLAEKCPDSADKIHRIHNGLPLNQDSPPSRAGREPASHPCPLSILSVGRLIEFKGFVTLVEACGLLRDRAIPFRCEIIGDGPLHETLSRQIREAGLGDQVELLGLRPQEEVQKRMRACDVFALACGVDHAGACDVLPTVILEAMALAKPVVSTRLAGVPEMVEDGQTGLLAPPDDPGALADAFQALATDPARRASLGEAGRKKMEARFSAADTSRRLAELFYQSSGRAAAPTHRAPWTRGDGVGVTCLFAQWSINGVEPESGFPNFALLHLHSHIPGARLVALQANPVSSSERRARPLHPLTEVVARMVEFLPDAMVLEGEWREQAATAHLLESWRKELGNGFRTEDFLLAARRALYLSRQTPGGTGDVRHLHAVGAGALLPAWLLLKMGVVQSASFLLPSLLLPGGGTLPESALRRLAPHFLHGWIVGNRKLAGFLGPQLRGDDLPGGSEGWQLWAGSLRTWAELDGPATRMEAARVAFP